MAYLKIHERLIFNLKVDSTLAVPHCVCAIQIGKHEHGIHLPCLVYTFRTSITNILRSILTIAVGGMQVIFFLLVTFHEIRLDVLIKIDMKKTNNNI